MFSLLNLFIFLWYLYGLNIIGFYIFWFCFFWFGHRLILLFVFFQRRRVLWFACWWLERLRNWNILFFQILMRFCYWSRRGWNFLLSLFAIGLSCLICGNFSIVFYWKVWNLALVCLLRQIRLFDIWMDSFQILFLFF